MNRIDFEKVFKAISQKPSGRNFTQLNERECLELHAIVRKNSEKLVRDAGILAKNKSFGTAISLSILASEEMTKGLILFLNGIGIRLANIKGLKSMFYRHRPRHFLASQVLLFYKFSRPIWEIWLGIKERSKEISEKKIGNILNANKKYFEDIDDEIEWWLRADSYKNRGFYVDYVNEILSPDQVLEEEMQKSLKHVESYIALCSHLIREIGNCKSDKLRYWVGFSNRVEIKEIIASVLADCEKGC